MKKNFTFLFLIAFVFNAFSQCDETETISICDMTIIDFDSDGTPDGIINLYDAYNAISGATPISSSDGDWFDPNFNFALDSITGDLHLWDLSNASNDESSYQFQLIDNSSTCIDGIRINFNIIIGPFSGVAIPTLGINEVNIEICDIPEENGCLSKTKFDLFQTLLSNPSAHSNGVWSYDGTSPNFIEITENRFLEVNIPYQPGLPLVDEEDFELTYTVNGISPCSDSVETKVKISVIRGAFSGATSGGGFASISTICESDIIDGLYNDDIDLTDDAYLVQEDIEGTWSDNDNTGQIENPLDSFINLRELYDDLISITPRFESQEYNYSYNVDSRAAVCFDMVSTVNLNIIEALRPFEQESPEEICFYKGIEGTLDLYNLITFTTENGTLYDYPKDEETKWELISGPSDLGLLDSSLGTINYSYDDIGTYVFKYTVSEKYNGSSLDLSFQSPQACEFSMIENICEEEEFALVTIIFLPYNYPGENTTIDICESNVTNPLDLFTLLETNGLDTLYEGPDSYWYNVETSENISNEFTIPEIDGEKTFEFEYHITANGCEEQVTLSFTVFEDYNSGEDTTVNICIEDIAFELFESLEGTPNNNGTWEGPNGYTSGSNLVNFDPSTFESGTYSYTVPANGTCTEHTSTVTVNINPVSNAGDNVQESVCKLDNTIDLFDLLDVNADSGGTFTDTDNSNALSGSFVDLSILNDTSYNFQYDVQINTSCTIASSIITLTIIQVEAPIIIDQTFCIGDSTTISDLEFTSNLTDHNWYATQNDSEILDLDLILQDNEDYYIEAVDDNNCKSERVKVVISLLLFGQEGCISCIPDGITANGDNENDVLELCDLPTTYPNFELKIFNRYGVVIYSGNKNTPFFDGTSNVGIAIGNQVPTGVYFYIFNPNDNSEPFQGDFYLSK